VIITQGADQLGSAPKKHLLSMEINFFGRKNVKEVKYFHPSGKSLPNGSHFQRGGFLHECQQNKDAYVLDESVHGEQCGLSKCRGGVITFPNQFKEKSESVGMYSVGNFFKGKFVGESGEVYDETSLSIDVNGLSSESLIQFAENIAEKFHQETVLVKDLNNGKVFLVGTPL
jgi:hypothetical protein